MPQAAKEVAAEWQVDSVLAVGRKVASVEGQVGWAGWVVEPVG